jgi:transcriptional regulator with XRE-family HTH domain
MYDKFRQLLEKNNVKPSKVANAIGISPVVFTDWKKGKSKPKVDKLVLIANYFNVTIEYFLEGDKNESKGN